MRAFINSQKMALLLLAVLHFMTIQLTFSNQSLFRCFEGQGACCVVRGQFCARF